MAELNPAAVPLSLYIHMPWCVRKCPYCDFNSHAVPDGQLSLELEQEYLRALVEDFKTQVDFAQGRQIHSVFIGGGTPSLISAPGYQWLFDQLKAVIPFAEGCEITLEANPGTVEHDPFAGYLQAGINRLSIGVQSFNTEHLKRLGRIHSNEDAISAIGLAREAGFQRINVDLMHGLPEQTLDQALHDLKLAVEQGATHISWYQLTIEPNTVFYRNQPILPDEDSLADIEQAGQTLLEHLGYDNYEVSAWAGASDKPCRHNVNYWQFGDYLAIGAGAHGKVTIDDRYGNQTLTADKVSDEVLKKVSTETGIYRFSKSRMPKDYITFDIDTMNNIKKEGAPKMVGWQAIASDELVSEFMLNALRLHEGVTWSLFEARTGLSYDNIALEVNQLIKQGLLVDDNEHLQPTALGRRYLNQILRVFL